MTTTNQDRTLVMTDAGTHGGPRETNVYRLANGKYQTVVKHGNAVISSDVTDKCPAGSSITTDGRVRVLAAK